MGSLLLLFFLLVALPTRAATVDVGFTGGTQDIFFSKEKFVIGESLRMYARVHNFGDTDVAAHVLFYHGSSLIGEAQPVSVRSRGLSDEVYVDWTIPEGTFNIRAEVRGQSPRDENPANDIALTALFTGEKPPPPPPASTAGLAISVGSPTRGGGIATGNTATSVGSASTKSTKSEKKQAGASEGAPSPFTALAPPLSPTRVGQLAKEVATAIESALSVPTPIPDLLKVTIDVRQRNWNSFLFTADTNRNNGVSYEWSFGDGKTARGKDVHHSFRFAGRYIVSVVAHHESGERAQEKMTLDLSFWHLTNWQLWLILLFLVALVILLLTSSKEKRITHPHERSAVEEGDMPPVLLAEESKTPPPAQKKRRSSRRRKKQEETPPSPEDIESSTDFE